MSIKRKTKGAQDLQRMQDKISRSNIRDETNKIPAQVISVYYPGQEHTEKYGDHLNSNTVRVKVEPLRGEGSGYRAIIRETVFPLNMDPNVFASLIGSDAMGSGGLVGGIVEIVFSRSAILTGEAHLIGINSLKNSTDPDKSDSHKALRFDLGSGLLG